MTSPTDTQTSIGVCISLQALMLTVRGRKFKMLKQGVLGRTVTSAVLQVL
jgi:hypothetical protein